VCISAISPLIQAKPGVVSCSSPLRHELHADADAQERRARAGCLLDRLVHARDRGEPARAVGECALAGQHDPVGPAHLGGVAGHPHLGGEPLPLGRQRQPARR